MKYETPEVSDAKTEVADILGTDFGGYEDDAPFDNIEACVERLQDIRKRLPVPPSL